VIDVVNEKWPKSSAGLPNTTEDHSLTLLFDSAAPTAAQQKAIGPGGVGSWVAKKVPPKERRALRQDGPPPYLAMRFANVIPASTLTQLLVLWDHLNTLDVQYPDADHRRSSQPALHLGIWELFKAQPIVTADSRQMRQKNLTKRAEIVEAIDALLGLIKMAVVPILERLMARYVPGQQRVQERCVSCDWRDAKADRCAFTGSCSE
jgi:hypothetical protein